MLDLPSALVDQVRRGQVVLFLGAGASFDAVVRPTRLSRPASRMVSLGFVLLCISLIVTPARAQVEISQVEIGAHFGFNFSNGEIEHERVGLQTIVPILGPVELAPVFSYIYNFNFIDYIYNFFDDPTGRFTGSAWEGYLTARVRPFGRGSFWALGYGFTVAHASLSDRSSGRSWSDTEFTDLVVVALELPDWSIRPMVELYLISILDREGGVGAHALFGVNVVLP